jgi:hypothetical protein
MSLIKPESSIHNHLDRKEARKHEGIHTVTSATHPVAGQGEATPHERPFGEIVLDGETPDVTTHPKSILGL